MYQTKKFLSQASKRGKQSYKMCAYIWLGHHFAAYPKTDVNTSTDSFVIPRKV